MKSSLIFIAAMVSCGFQMNDTHLYLYYIDPSFSPDQQAIVRGAALEWQNAVEETITLVETSSPDGSNVIKIRPYHFVDADRKVGEATPYYKDIVIGDNLTPRNTRLVALHELGHTFGLGHSAPKTIMCYSLGCSSNEITCEDVWQFCNVWKCNAAQMKICQKD
jgi:hypothetical protein